jgi:Ca2+-binding RTX toxin-like protein
MTVGQSLGIGLNGVTDYSTELPFLDLFKTSRSWITHGDTQWDTQESNRLDLDANGWVRSLPATQDTQTGTSPQYTSVGTLMLTELSGDYYAGRYVVQYDGTGTLNYGGAARKVDSLSTPGRDVIEVDGSGNGIDLRITQTDPQRTGDYLRNIHVYRESDLPLVELGLTFNPEWLNKIKDFGTLRFMDWMRTNGSNQKEWANRPTASSETWGTDSGVPVEVMVDLANQTGVSPWFNMPHGASDDYIRKFAEYVRDHLDPKLTAYVEFSNEVWNWMFPQSQYAVKQAEARWGKDAEAGWMQWYGMRTAQMSQIWKQAFGDQANRVKSVISTQTAWKGLENPVLNTPEWVKEGNQPAYKYVDAYAVTGYISGELGSAENADTVREWLKEPDGGVSKALQQLRYGGLLQGQDSLPDVIDRFKYHAGVAQQHGLQLVAYEGGQHIVNAGTISNNAADDTALSNLFMELNRRPEMQQIYQNLLEGWKAAGGTLFNHFVDVSRSTKYGSWGALENLQQSTSPKYAALTDFLNKYERWWSESDTTTRIGLFQRGTAANDLINGSDQNDILLGSAGDDTINGGAGNDSLHGGAGNDSIDGGDGNDLILGGAGNDTLSGGAGNDTLNGGTGNNLLDGGSGHDTYKFGTGRDFATDVGYDQIQFKPGADRLLFDPKTFQAGTTVGVVATDAEAADRSEQIIYSLDSGNLFYNENGSASGLGKGGMFATLINKPQLTAAELVDPAASASNNQPQPTVVPFSIPAPSSNQPVAESAPASTSTSTSQPQPVAESTNSAFASASLSNGQITRQVSSKANGQTLTGTAGADLLNGGAGNDTLLGMAGNDTLNGGSGNDLLVGGTGRDLLTGGAGADQFVFSFNSKAAPDSVVRTPDRITDFNSQEGDRIRITQDGSLSGETVKGLFNAGLQAGNTLTDATRSAFANKSGDSRTVSPLAANEAVLFSWRNKIYLGINDSQQNFMPNRDMVIELTGIRSNPGDMSKGKLTVADYFAR